MDAKLGDGGEEAAEHLLEEYLGGSNDRKLSIDRTTPVFQDSAGKVYCMLPGNQVGHEGLHPMAVARCQYLFLRLGIGGIPIQN